MSEWACILRITPRALASPRSQPHRSTRRTAAGALLDAAEPLSLGAHLS
jgi:hypothetical protein